MPSIEDDRGETPREYINVPRWGRGGGKWLDRDDYPDMDSLDVKSMRTKEKIEYMLFLSLGKLSSSAACYFTKEDLAYLAGGFAVMAGLEFTPFGWAFDAALLAFFTYRLGEDGIRLAKRMVKAFRMANRATSFRDLDDAASLLAGCTAQIGLTVIFGFILHKAVPARGMLQLRPTDRPYITIPRSFDSRRIAPKKIDEYVHKRENELEADQQKFERMLDNGRAGELRKIEEVETDEFTPLGITEDRADNFLKTPDGQQMLEDYLLSHPTMPNDEILDKLQEVLMSSDQIPFKKNDFAGYLYKIQHPKYSNIDPNTTYFTTMEELEKAGSISAQGGASISEQFGLPQSSTRDEYRIMRIESKEPTTVFVSKIAPTVEGKIQKPGGATQYLIFDQSKFKPAMKWGKITDKGVRSR